MNSLPQLTEEDVQQLDSILRRLVANSDVTTAAIIDKGGFLIAHAGGDPDSDLTTLAALASGAFMASQSIANLLREDKFDSTYQQGEKSGMVVVNVDENCLITLIFRADISVGAVKYFAAAAVPEIARQMRIAAERSPGAGFDLSALNLADTSPLFRKRAD